jgi:hypothetical protein
MTQALQSGERATKIAQKNVAQELQLINLAHDDFEEAPTLENLHKLRGELLHASLRLQEITNVWEAALRAVNAS